MSKFEEYSNWWRGWLALGLAFGSAELIVNAGFGRFPLFLLPTFNPVLAIPVGAVSEVAVWVTISLGIGALTELGRRIFRGPDSWHFGVRVTALLILEAFVARMLLSVGMRHGIFRVFAPPKFDDGRVIAGIIIVASGVGVWAAWSRRWVDGERRRCDCLRAVLFAASLAAVYAVVYNRWMSTTVLPLPPARWWIGGVVLVAVLLGAVAFRRGWKPLSLAFGFYLAALAATDLLTGWYSWPTANEKPNIVVLLWDTARAGRMSLYGYGQPTTPGLESLAPHSIVFEAAYSPSNYTYPSHVSIFLGESYRSHNYHIGGGRDYQDYQEEYPLPQRLGELGYHPVLLTENSWVLAADKGFAEVRYCPMLETYSDNFNRECEFSARRSLRKYAEPFLGRMVVDAVEYWFDGFYAYTLENIQFRFVRELFLRSRRTGPVFLFWNWMTIHDRYHPYGNWEPGTTVKDYDFSGEYDLAVRYADERLMKFYRQLAGSDQLGETVLIVTSDHGEFLGEYGLFGHNKALFEAVLRVPLIVSHPNLQPRRVTLPVSLIDFRFLVEALTGSPDLLASEGIAENLIRRKEVIAEHGYLPEETSTESWWSYSVIDSKMQYIFDPLIGTWKSNWPPDQPEFLFDRVADPLQKTNLHGTGRGNEPELKEIYSVYLKGLPEEGFTKAVDGAKAEKERKLRALGYLK